MSFGTSTSRRLWSPFIAIIWAVAAVIFAGTAQGEDSTGTDDSSMATTTGSDAAPAATPTPPPPPPKATDHPSGPSAGDAPEEPTSPQPISTADDNTGGANGQCPGGPYCSTTDGSPSGNGNGGGEATGEPCAGCVGKADNKNPQGQMPDASDANAGYECDTNHGIARGNPAHSGCQTAPPQECVPTPTVPCVPPPVCVPTPTVPCVPPPVCVPTPTVPCAPPPVCVPTPTVPCVPSPPPVCVPTPTVPCVPSPPECVTGCVSPPLVGSGAPNPPATTVSPPSSTQGLPNTGAPSGLAWLGIAAAASIVAGAVLTLRGARRGLAHS